MANLGFVNILSWPPDQVANWLKGLTEVIQPFVHRFMEAGIDGARLLSLTHSDLANLGIEKLGQQEIVLEAIDLLIQLHYEMETTNLQSLALLTSCRSRSLFCSLQTALKRPQLAIKAADNSVSPQLALVSQMVVAMKKLTNWLNRPPFDTSETYLRIQSLLLHHIVAVIEATVSHNHLANRQLIMQTCRQVCELCDALVQTSKDSLIIQPTHLELATIRKKPDEEVGLNIQSVNGVHVISIVKERSAAQQCGRVEEGDEVVQVNYETVVGWELNKLVVALKENQREVTLTLKKRPRHVALESTKRNKKKMADVPGTFPKSTRRSGGKNKGLEKLLNLLELPDYSFKAETDDEAETETAVKRRESCVLTVDSDVDSRQRRATVSGPAARLALKQVQMLKQQECRPKSTGGQQGCGKSGTTYGSLPTSRLSSPDHSTGAVSSAVSAGAVILLSMAGGDEARLGKLLAHGGGGWCQDQHASSNAGDQRSSAHMSCLRSADSESSDDGTVDSSVASLVEATLKVTYTASAATGDNSKVKLVSQ